MGDPAESRNIYRSLRDCILKACTAKGTLNAPQGT